MGLSSYNQSGWLYGLYGKYSLVQLTRLGCMGLYGLYNLVQSVGTACMSLYGVV